MKSCLTVFLALSLVFLLVLGGIILAVRPPFTVVTAETEDIQLEAAITSYLEERVEIALDNYSNQGDLEISLDQGGLSTILAGSLNQAVPNNLLTGVYMNIGDDQMEIGGAFKFWIFPVGVSGRFGVNMEDENINLELLSSRIGRLPLPLNFVANIFGKYADFPDDKAPMSVSFPLETQDHGLDAVFTGLSLKQGEVLISIFLEEGLIPDIPEEVLDNFDRAYPDLEDAVKNNPEAISSLHQIKHHIDSKEDGKTLNPLTLKRLGDELYSTLTQEEMEDLEAILESDSLLDFLQKVN